MLTHCVYANAAATYKLWRRQQYNNLFGAFELALVGFWVLIFMWTKVGNEWLVGVGAALVVMGFFSLQSFFLANFFPYKFCLPAQLSFFVRHRVKNPSWSALLIRRVKKKVACRLRVLLFNAKVYAALAMSTRTKLCALIKYVRVWFAKCCTEGGQTMSQKLLNTL